MKPLILTVILSWVLAACTPAAVAPPTPLAAAPTSAPVATVAPTVMAPTAALQPTAAVEPTVAPSPVPPTAVVIKDEFTPTDPRTVNLALGKPQFVEFYSQY